jgi:hypothetical protein
MKSNTINYSISYVTDILGFSASTLCAIHCSLLPVTLTFLPIIGYSFLTTHAFEWIMLASSVLIAFISFLNGYYKHHHSDEPLSLMLIAFIFFTLGHPREVPNLLDEIFLPRGGATMAYAHFRNWKLCKEANCKMCKEE